MKAWKKTVMLLMGAVLPATLPTTTLAAGWGYRGDDCAPGTRNARAEWRPAFCRSKQLERLDCAGLAAYGASTQYAVNTRYLALYQRPMLTAATAPASSATADPLLPMLEPPDSTVPPAAPIRYGVVKEPSAAP